MSVDSNQVWKLYSDVGSFLQSGNLAKEEALRDYIEGFSSPSPGPWIGLPEAEVKKDLQDGSISRIFHSLWFFSLDTSLIQQNRPCRETIQALFRHIYPLIRHIYPLNSSEDDSNRTRLIEIRCGDISAIFERSFLTHLMGSLPSFKRKWALPSSGRAPVTELKPTPVNRIALSYLKGTSLDWTEVDHILRSSHAKETCHKTQTLSLDIKFINDQWELNSGQGINWEGISSHFQENSCLDCEEQRDVKDEIFDFILDAMENDDHRSLVFKALLDRKDQAMIQKFLSKINSDWTFDSLYQLAAESKRTDLQLFLIVKAAELDKPLKGQMVPSGWKNIRFYQETAKPALFQDVSGLQGCFEIRVTKENSATILDDFCSESQRLGLIFDKRTPCPPFRIFCSNLQEEQALVFISTLSKFRPPLTHLALTFCQLGLTKPEVLGRLPRCQLLDLSYNSINSEGVQVLTTALKKQSVPTETIPPLTSLLLAGNLLEDKDVRAVLALRHGMTRLELSGNKLTPGELDALLLLFMNYKKFFMSHHETLQIKRSSFEPLYRGFGSYPIIKPTLTIEI